MNSDDDRHITRVSKVSEIVLSAQRESSHLTAILGDKSLESFWLQVTEASTQFRDKDSLGSCSWISGRRVGCGQGFVIVWLHLPFLSVLPSTALPTHRLHFPSDRKADILYPPGEREAASHGFSRSHSNFFLESCWH